MFEYSVTNKLSDPERESVVYMVFSSLKYFDVLHLRIYMLKQLVFDVLLFKKPVKFNKNKCTLLISINIFSNSSRSFLYSLNFTS